MRAEHLEPFQGSLQSSPRILEVSRAICGASRARKQDIPHHLIRMEISFHILQEEGVQLPDAALG